jgi:hypothetical protein
LERTDEELLCQENYVDFERGLKDNPTPSSARRAIFCSNSYIVSLGDVSGAGFFGAGKVGDGAADFENVAHIARVQKIYGR